MELATQSFQKAIELDRKYNKRDEWPLVDFAVYQRMGGNPEASISLLKEALTINPDSPKANYEMGELLRDMRRYDEARKYLETALKLDPCNARTIYSLAIVTGNWETLPHLRRFSSSSRKWIERPGTR